MATPCPASAIASKECGVRLSIRMFGLTPARPSHWESAARTDGETGTTRFRYVAERPQPLACLSLQAEALALAPRAPLRNSAVPCSLRATVRPRLPVQAGVRPGGRA